MASSEMDNNAEIFPQYYLCLHPDKYIIPAIVLQFDFVDLLPGLFCIGSCLVKFSTEVAVEKGLNV